MRGEILVLILGRCKRTRFWDAPVFPGALLDEEEPLESLRSSRDDGRSWLEMSLLHASPSWRTLAPPMPSNHQVLALLIPTPPLAEQAKIAGWLDRQTTAADRLVDAVRTQIDKLREYRQALITAVVTGQIAIPPRDPA